jgi:hypothetical protein
VKCRVVALVVCACASACASSKSATALEEKCRADPGHDPRCVDVLTQSGDQLEAKEEVMRAEQAREDDAFADHLAKMRKERDAKTSTVSAGGLGDLAAGEEMEGDEEVDSGSSIRALAPALKLKDGSKDSSRESSKDSSMESSKESLKANQPKVTAETQRQENPQEASAVTPEIYLRGASCLLDRDVAAIKERLKPAAKKARAELALALVDADALSQDVHREIEHRGLPRSGDPNCTTRMNAEMVDVLESLLGPAPKLGESAESYGRGLGRLRKELESRAGLPRQPASE